MAFTRLMQNLWSFKLTDVKIRQTKYIVYAVTAIIYIP